MKLLLIAYAETLLPEPVPGQLRRMTNCYFLRLARGFDLDKNIYIILWDSKPMLYCQFTDLGKPRPAWVPDIVTTLN